jgi:hypothetical protein
VSASRGEFHDTWSKVAVDPQAAAGAVVAGWQRGDLPGLRLGELTAEEALALERPAMTYVRAQLGDRLQRQLARAYRRWLHPTSGHLSGDRSCNSGHPQAAAVSAADSSRPDGVARWPRFRKHNGRCRGVRRLAGRLAADTGRPGRVGDGGVVRPRAE